MFRQRILSEILLAATALAVQASTPFILEDDLRGLPAEDLSISFNKENLKHRLPKNIIPASYKLDITPVLHTGLDDFPLFSAPGLVEITFKCKNATNVIILNSKNIEFVQGDVKVRRGVTDVPVTSLAFSDVTETATIVVNADLVVDEPYVIEIKFMSKVNEGSSGLFQASYLDDANERRYIATTQFEKVGARQAFPCFDEPELRAVFNIRVGRKKSTDYHTLSNMPKLDGTPVEVPGMPGYEFDVFKPTPSMPTYLIAIIVSDFSSTTAADPPNTNVKTWGPKNQIGVAGDTRHAQFSADLAAKLLVSFNEYFNTIKQDPIGKLDSVAIPDFSGAMENWGLNTYRKDGILFVDGDMTQHELWRQCAVIAHEISHQWFGNAVTIKWWNNLWIKEGFARYLQFLGVAAAGDPQLLALDRIVLDATQIALEHDARPDTHPIWGDWEDTIETQNSRIIYEKGASLIRMMEGFLNEINDPTPVPQRTTLLQRAFRKYLDTYPLGATAQDDLYAALQAQIDEDKIDPEGKSIKEIMDTWTRQEGFPLVRISRVSSRRIYASQEPYVADKEVRKSNRKNTNTWEIPVTFLSGNDEAPLANYRPKGWIGANDVIASIPADSTSRWLLVNPEAKSYYRVLYDGHFFTLLQAQLESEGGHTVIPATSRSQLFDDYFNFAFAEYAPFDKVLDLTNYLEDEDELVVWTTVLTHLRKIYNYLQSTHDDFPSNPVPNPAFVELKDAFKPKIFAAFKRLTDKPSGTLTRSEWMLKALLMDWVCVLDSDACLEQTEDEIFDWAFSEDSPVVADIQPMVFCRAYREPDAPPRIWRKLITERYVATKIVPRNYDKWLYRARGCVPLKAEIKAALEATIDPLSDVPAEHRKSLIQQIAGRSEKDAIDETFAFLEEKYEEIITYIGDDAISIAISALSTHLSTETEQAKVKAYHDKQEHQNLFGEKLLESIRSSIAAIEKNREMSGVLSKIILCYYDSAHPSCTTAVTC